MKKIRKNVKSLWRDKTLVLMSLPALVFIILFQLVPMTGLVLAFKKFDYSQGLYGSPWCGLDNIKYLFLNGGKFWTVTRNTLFYYVLFAATGVVFEVALAIAINSLTSKRLAKYGQSILILPTFVSWVAVSYIVDIFLNYHSGMINNWLVDNGSEPINFFLKANMWPAILLIINVWKQTGYSSILYLSALSGIDQELYQAASIDGATAFKKMRYITIPMLIPTVTIRLLLGLGSCLHSDNGLFFQVTKNTGALYETTQVLDSYVYSALVTSSGTNFSTLSATTLYQSVVGCILVIVTNLIVRKFAPENALF